MIVILSSARPNEGPYNHRNRHCGGRDLLRCMQRGTPIHSIRVVGQCKIPRVGFAVAQDDNSKEYGIMSTDFR